MKNNNKKTSKEKRVLIGALCVAAVMVAGSTFAWFTSKDEVTNRLSASAEYNVAVAETFQPPENWVPGQEINKDAAAVNTGNVDAFARMWLTGSMRLLQQSKTTANDKAQYNTSASFDTITGALTDVKDANLLNASLTRMDTEGNYFKTLDKSQTINPGASAGTNNGGYAINENLTNSASGPYSEVQAMQSGILAYAPSGAKYSYVLDEEAELKVYLTSNVNGTSTTDYKTVRVPAGTLVIAGAQTTDTFAPLKAATLNADGTLKPDNTSVTITSSAGSTHAYTSTVYIESQTTGTDFFVPQNIEFESFTPMTDGLYLFLRNENNTDQADPEFSGYYVSGITGQTPAAGTYYALNTGTQDTTTPVTYRSDYTVKGAKTATYTAPIQVAYDDADAGKNLIKVTPTANLELFTAKYANVAAADLKWYYDATDNAERIIALYDKDNGDDFDENDDVAVEIMLANVKDTTNTGAETWTAIGAGADAVPADLGVSGTKNASKLTFYYNNDIEAGDSSKKLVDKVKLYDGVTQKAYLAFDFDLNVNLESVQVTMDENGKELATAVNGNTGWAATGTVNTVAKGTADNASGDAKEIGTMTWSALS